MQKLGLITVLFALLFSSFTGCDNSPLDKKKEEAKRTEKEKGPKLTKRVWNPLINLYHKEPRKELSLWMKL